MEKARFQALDVQAENKNGVLAPVVCAVEHKKGKDEREDNGAKLDALTEELAAWSTYGGLMSKNLEGVRKGVEALSNFAVWEKNAADTA